MLEFDDATHSYKINGFKVPGVTSILRAVYPQFNAPEWYLTRGQALHRGTQLLDDGKLRWDTVDDAIAGQMKAWQAFRSDYPVSVIASEQALGHSLYRYAGTLDRMVSCETHGLTVLDIKSSITPVVRLQLAFYSMLWKANKRQTVNRAVAVELREDGTYRCLWIDKKELRQHEQEALATLTVYNFARANSITLRGDDEQPCRS